MSEDRSLLTVLKYTKRSSNVVQTQQWTWDGVFAESSLRSLTNPMTSELSGYSTDLMECAQQQRRPMSIVDFDAFLARKPCTSTNNPKIYLRTSVLRAFISEQSIEF